MIEFQEVETGLSIFANPSQIEQIRSVRGFEDQSEMFFSSGTSVVVKGSPKDLNVQLVTSKVPGPSLADVAQAIRQLESTVQKFR